RRHEGGIGKRLVEDARQLSHAVEEELRRDGERVVPRAERARRDVGVRPLVEAGDVEAEGEGGELAETLARDGRDGGRVEAAGEEDADRHVAHQRGGDGSPYVRPELRRRVVEAERERR